MGDLSLCIVSKPYPKSDTICVKISEKLFLFFVGGPDQMLLITEIN